MCNDPRFLLCIKDWSIRKWVIPTSFLRLAHLCKISYGKKQFNIIGSLMRGDTLIQFLPRGIFNLYYSELDATGFPADEILFRVPCRKCLGCLSDRRRSWTERVSFESKQYKKNSFITLTYNEENLPPTLLRRHYQLFMKRLRERCRASGRPSPRMFYRGEYGDRKGRPHFHAILLNYEPPDLKLLWYTRGKGTRYRVYKLGMVPVSSSEELTECWKCGHVFHEPVSRGSIHYVANYLDKGASWLTRDGVVTVPPFNGYSSRPALGLVPALKKAATPEGREELMNMGVPYFKRLLKELDPEDYEYLLSRQRAIARGSVKPWEKTSLSEEDYLKQREERMRAQLEKFGRRVDFSLDPFSELAIKRNKASPPVAR